MHCEASDTITWPEFERIATVDQALLTEKARQELDRFADAEEAGMLKGADPLHPFERELAWNRGRSEWSARDLFEAMDQNEDEQLSHEGFTVYLERAPWALSYIGKHLDWRGIWSMYDSDEDDHLDAAEFEALYKQKLHPLILAQREVASSHPVPSPASLGKLAGALAMVSRHESLIAAKAAGNAAKKAGATESHAAVVAGKAAGAAVLHMGGNESDAAAALREAVGVAEGKEEEVEAALQYTTALAEVLLSHYTSHQTQPEEETGLKLAIKVERDAKSPAKALKISHSEWKATKRDKDSRRNKELRERKRQQDEHADREAEEKEEKRKRLLVRKKELDRSRAKKNTADKKEQDASRIKLASRHTEVAVEREKKLQEWEQKKARQERIDAKADARRKGKLAEDLVSQRESRWKRSTLDRVAEIGKAKRVGSSAAGPIRPPRKAKPAKPKQRRGGGLEDAGEEVSAWGQQESQPPQESQLLGESGMSLASSPSHTRMNTSSSHSVSPSRGFTEGEGSGGVEGRDPLVMDDGEVLEAREEEDEEDEGRALGVGVEVNMEAGAVSVADLFGE